MILDLGPEQWWNEQGEPLRIQVVETRMVDAVDEDATVTWMAVSGWRLLPGGGRRWEREVLVHIDALPGERDR